MAKPRKPAPPPPPTAHQLIDRALKSDWDAALATLSRSTTDHALAWDTRYETIGTILDHDPPLYLAAGITSAKAFLAKYDPGVAPAQVRANVRVANHFTAEHESAHGVSKLALLLDYLEAKNHGALPAMKIDPDKTQVEVRDGRMLRRAPFKSLSYDALRAVVRVAKTKGGRAKTTDTPFVRAIRKLLAAKKLDAVAVRIRGTSVDFSNVPVADLVAFARALVAFKPPK